MQETEPDSTVPIRAAAAETVACPYCAEHIKPNAIVCKHCSRDLYFFAPLLQRLAAMETAIHIGEATTAGKLSQRLDRIEASLAALTAERTPLRADGDADDAAGAPESPESPESPTAGPTWLRSLSTTLGCLIALVAAFTMLSLVFDVKEVYLRVASILIPVPFAFVHVARHRFHFLREAVFALLVTCAFLAIVSGIMARLQDLPWAPQDAREWRELITYGSSILCAWFSGAILAKILAERTGLRSAGPLALEAARLLASFSTQGRQRGDQVKALASALQSFASNVAIVGTSAAAIWTGVGKLFQ